VAVCCVWLAGPDLFDPRFGKFTLPIDLIIAAGIFFLGTLTYSTPAETETTASLQQSLINVKHTEHC